MEGVNVVWFDESMGAGEALLDDDSGIPSEGSAIDTDDDVSVWQERVVFLKTFDVFVARLGHCERTGIRTRQ